MDYLRSGRGAVRQGDCTVVGGISSLANQSSHLRDSLEKEKSKSGTFFQSHGSTSHFDLTFDRSTMEQQTGCKAERSS